MTEGSSSVRGVKDLIFEKVGFLPKDAVSWLYVARGLYKLKDYHHVIEAVSFCLRNEKTSKEAQHLLAFSLLNTGQPEQAAAAFLKSVSLGNESDWQPLVELCIENPKMQLRKGTQIAGASVSTRRI
mmetsp:Transcript_13461/g.23135  ORF Transcript_13461/g.23135 Transcript_13461/m.23135 type:complete len:127 (+) Transcript_13461:89-469(+)